MRGKEAMTEEKAPDEQQNKPSGRTQGLGSFNVMLPGGLTVSGTGIIGLVIAVVLVLLGVLLVPRLLAPDAIYTEPIQTSGTNGNPFMPSVGNDHRDVTAPLRTSGTFAGNTSGLYGGTLNNSTCDRQEMIKFLQAHPDKGAAWVQVQGIIQADLPSYISSLTPVLLRSDTSVTNHGFSDGHATTLHSVLQAGTAVLVDKYGVPRARCYCGNPLTPPNPPATKRYVGPSWSGFSPASITTIKPAAAEIAEFTLVNPYTNEIIYRLAGTAGEQDRSQTPPPVSIPETPSPPVSTPETPPDPPDPPDTSEPPRVVPTVEPQPHPQTQVPPVKDADIAGTYTLNRSVISCTGFEQCYTDPMNIHIDDCNTSHCTITWPDGWARSHTLTFNGSTWRTSGPDEGANDCDGAHRPGSIMLELTVTSAAIVDGAWKAQTFQGAYSFESPAFADCSAGEGVDQLYN